MRYRVTNSAGGTEHGWTTDREEAILRLLTIGDFAGEVLDEHGQAVDISGYDVEYDDDGQPALVER